MSSVQTRSIQILQTGDGGKKCFFCEKRKEKGKRHKRRGMTTGKEERQYTVLILVPYTGLGPSRDFVGPLRLNQ